jgi:hypothetical protein
VNLVLHELALLFDVRVEINATGKLMGVLAENRVLNDVGKCDSLFTVHHENPFEKVFHIRKVRQLLKPLLLIDRVGQVEGGSASSVDFSLHIVT